MIRTASHVFVLVLSLSVAAYGATNANGSTNSTVVADSPVGGDVCSKISDLGASGKTTDQAGKGNCAAKNAIGQGVSALVKLNVLNSVALQTGVTKYNSSWQSCINKQSVAAQACLENMSTNLSDATSAVNSIISAVKSSSSNSSCSDFGKAMDLAQQALSAFSAACAAAKGTCISSCGEAISALDQIKTAANSASCAPEDATCAAGLEAAKQALLSSIEQDKVTSDKTTTAGKNALCTNKYADQLKSAASGIGSMLSGLLQGNQCADATAAVDCNDASQANTTTCLCQANPRLPGCDNALQKVGETSEASITPSAATLSSDSSTPTLDGSSASDPVSGAATESSALGGSSGVGAPIGSSSGLSSTAATAAAASGKSLDTNVYVGTEGGRGGSGRTLAGAEAPAKYRDYLPGGIKDPQRTSGNAAATEVTSGAGKSNWEKVRERYLDNKPSLINN